MLKDKGILITGAGRGIGKRLAIGFASAGARVGLLARSKAELDLANLEIEHAGGVSIRLRADVRDYEQIVAAVEKMKVHFGSIQVLICSAGVLGPIGPLVDTDPKAWAEAVTVNLVGAMNSIRAVLPHLKQQRSGKIILLAGEGADHPRPGFSSYAAAKAGIVRLAESLAAELLDDNIQVNCMKPGETYTSMTDEILSHPDKAGWKESQDAALVRATGGVAPQRQVEVATFLASERSNHITGKLIHVGDDLKKLEHAHVHSEAYTLRRLLRVHP